MKAFVSLIVSPFELFVLKKRLEAIGKRGIPRVPKVLTPNVMSVSKYS